MAPRRAAQTQCFANGKGPAQTRCRTSRRTAKLALAAPARMRPSVRPAEGLQGPTPPGGRYAQAATPASAGARGGRFRQIHFQDGHVEGVRDFAVFFILEEHADEFAVDVNFHRIRLLWPFDHGDRVQPEQVSQVFFEAPDFAAGQVCLPSSVTSTRMGPPTGSRWA